MFYLSGTLELIERIRSKVLELDINFRIIFILKK